MDAPEVVDRFVFGDQVIFEAPVSCVLNVTAPPVEHINAFEGLEANIGRTVKETAVLMLGHVPLLSSA